MQGMVVILNIWIEKQSAKKKNRYREDIVSPQKKLQLCETVCPGECIFPDGSSSNCQLVCQRLMSRTEKQKKK
jgi:hypothetical protein